MKKLLIACLLPAMFIGCATNTTKVLEQKNAPEQSYRLAGQDKALVIKGNLSRISTPRGDVNRVLKVYINEELAINDVLDLEASDELKGRWKNKKVSASCYTKANTQTTRCLIFVSNQRTVTLAF